MNAGPKYGPRDNQEDTRVAVGRPEPAAHITYAKAAERLIDNGFEPLPIIPGQKRPAPARWSSVALTTDCIEDWLRRYPEHGVGLRTGRLIGLDIDELDPDCAHEAHSLAVARFGETLVRVGQWPKRLLLYRTDMPFPKMKTGKVEILGAGQQFVAFGLHSGTGQPYAWTTGETPLDIHVDDLPVIDQDRVAAFLAELGSGEDQGVGRARREGKKSSPASGKPVRNASGIVVDGRDDWLSRIAFHAVHDARDAGGPFVADRIADRVWENFADSTDLGRARQGGLRGYGWHDALQKVQDKLRLVGAGALPERDRELAAPEFEAPKLSVVEGRARLEELLRGFSQQVALWHRGEAPTLPTLGIRATVGLGKSRSSRKYLLALAKTLKAEHLPYRILVFAASHVLAEETAAAWKEAGARVAVLLGYERLDPASGEPLCRDLEAVHAALAARLPVKSNACAGADGTRCRFRDGCLKQKNLDDVANADVVVAPYDALFSGFAFTKDDVALLLIDEGCWARAVEQINDIHVEDIPNERIAGMGNGIGRGPVGAMADLQSFRGKLATALVANGPGPARQADLLQAGLTAEDCRDAARLETWRMQDPNLRPGLSGEARQQAQRIAAENARIAKLVSLWKECERLLAGKRKQSGRLRVSPPDQSGRHRIDLRQIRCLHESLRGKPVLHLDATMRTELIRTILPELPVERIDVAAPYMHVRHVQGSFGKSMLCPMPGLAPDESRRRANRLRECVNYVRWHARRVHPKPVLVVTYMAVETAFDGIPNVEVAHFNAVAGLDCYKDVAMLISIGRPLPPSTELEALVGAYFDHVPAGRYRKDRTGIRMRGGALRGIEVIHHEDERAETLRAAICDDELTQVLGRGRGVNRGSEDPLEVHVLTDVALPLVYDRLTHWDLERPDILQQMLLAGMAVDSPADAAALHSGLFGGEKQAQKQFERAAFKRQTPIKTSYREMSLKSAAYRRSGRGRGWQRVWWLERDDADVRAMLESAFGVLGGWRSS
ncbi:MAG: hypothetical protein EP341_04015 [Sphingomonadales bacterium]|nr:MAG: hypothetical protein EP341_04015 [Sphingomonadales bacterium]